MPPLSSPAPERLDADDLPRLETPRLLVRALDRAEFALYLRDRARFAQTLRLAAVPEPLPEETQHALEWLYDVGASLVGPQFPWGTLWGVFVRSRNVEEAGAPRFAGSICFKGAPSDGEAEVAYTTESALRNQGVMTEALGAVVRWASGRGDAAALAAETEFGAKASRRVLEKVGFRQTSDAPFPLVDSIYWRLRLRG